MTTSAPDLLDRLFGLGYVTPDDLREIRELAVARGIPLLEAALLGNRLHHDARGWILAETIGIPFLEIEPDTVPLELAEALPEMMARENQIAPIAREGDRLTVAAADPFCHTAFSSIEEMAGVSVRMVLCPRRTIGEIISRLYPDPGGLLPADITGGAITREEAEDWLSLGGMRHLVERVLLHCASRGIPGLRMYPAGKDLVVEGRGGDEGKPVLLLSCPLRRREILQEAFLEMASASEHPSGLSEKVFHIESSAGVTACRASFVRGLSGPEVIVQVLPDLRSGISLDSVGLNAAQFDITQKVLGRGNGMFLVSSPGPEGGATTLYAMVRQVHMPGCRVVTVEERHRFRNEGYIQLVRSQVESGFSRSWTLLAESLEPDILMIENVSDPEDLAALLHLAESGVVVLCGIRRLNFDRALRTLLTLDVDPFTLAHVMRLAMHQRLVKLLCMECRRAVPAKPSLRMVGERYREELERVVTASSFFLPAGCPKCGGTGYSGKMALIELIPFTPAVENIVASDLDLEEKLVDLRAEDFYPAIESVHDLLRRGMVTYDDVLPFFR
ncbi:MAG: Flp pilus assembly complex ATPase component TadA [Deltaproteobacteria bacterium]|nr:Flp pilus assembly complex ATPase component TadA [Deltaproteobacteria bacterium]